MLSYKRKEAFFLSMALVELGKHFCGDCCLLLLDTEDKSV